MPVRLNCVENTYASHPYFMDLLRIQRVLADRGYVATLDQCQTLWREYSDSMDAGWCFMPDASEYGSVENADAAVFACIYPFIEED